MSDVKKKGRLFDLPETKGAFQLKGVVSGMDKDSAYKELKTRSNKDMRMLNFGVSYKENETLYPNLQGMEQEKVYFSKRAEKQGEKGETVSVAWSDRFTFNRDGFRMIGVNVGVKKKVDANGEVTNDKKVLTQFDACKEIHDNLKDNASVFVRGSLDYSSYVGNDGNKRTSTKLVPNQVSLCQDINFNDTNYVQQNDFNQVIIFMDIDQEKDLGGRPTGRFVVTAKIVTYSNIEDVEFIITDEKLARQFKKSLKPYNSIKVSGHMVASQVVDEVDDDDEWGESDAMERVSTPVKREFIISGAKGSSIDRDTYTEENVTQAIAKIRNNEMAESSFGSTSNTVDWGNTSTFDDDEAW